MCYKCSVILFNWVVCFIYLTHMAVQHKTPNLGVSMTMYPMLMRHAKQMMDCSLRAKATSLSLKLKRERWKMWSVAAARSVKHKSDGLLAGQMGFCQSLLHTNPHWMVWTFSKHLIESLHRDTLHATVLVLVMDKYIFKKSPGFVKY